MDLNRDRSKTTLAALLVASLTAVCFRPVALQPSNCIDRALAANPEFLDALNDLGAIEQRVTPPRTVELRPAVAFFESFPAQKRPCFGGTGVTPSPE